MFTKISLIIIMLSTVGVFSISSKVTKDISEKSKKTEKIENVLDSSSMAPLEVKTDGAVSGTINDPNAYIEVEGVDIDFSTQAKPYPDGIYFIKGFPRGTYTITINSNNNGKIRKEVFNDVKIHIGEVTMLPDTNF